MMGGRYWNGSYGNGVVGCELDLSSSGCECGTEPLGSMKLREFVD